MVDLTIAAQAFAEQLAADVERLDAAVMDGVEECVRRASTTVAEQARENHPYTDRTGDLTASIQAQETVRAGDTVRGGVEATTEYASYVGRTHPYLEPAFQAQRSRIEGESDQIMNAAVRGALR